MRFFELAIPGSFLVEAEPRRDERGSFSRIFDHALFREVGLELEIAQASVSRNAATGTLRGLHYQEPPYAESKLVRCTRGAVFDAIVDLRPGSPSFRSWASTRLDASEDTMLYVPPGVAHGFQTLAPLTELLYQISTEYSPAHARGVRWDDPAFGIEWPAVERRTISERDATYADFGI